MQVKEVMFREVITVKRSTTLRQLLEIFSKFHIFPLVPVVEEDNRLVGIVSFHNLIEAVQPHRPQILKTIPFLDEEKEDIFKIDFTAEIGDLVIVDDIMENKFIRTQTELLIYTLGFVLLTTGLAISLGFSVLLANMFFGTVLININKSEFNFFDPLKTVDLPLYLLFFVLAGANFEISLLLKGVGILGIVVYIFFRSIGKALGSMWGGYIVKVEDRIRKYLGFALLPQAGVALGCALIAKSDFPKVGNMLFTTIIATTVIYELIGPLCTKYALHKAGEIPVEVHPI